MATTGTLSTGSSRSRRRSGSSLAVADASPALGAFSSPESEWLVDPAEVQTEQTGLRSLLGAVQALEAGRDPR